jgi:DNA-directed RNA polymerase alpha subunit
MPFIPEGFWHQKTKFRRATIMFREPAVYKTYHESELEELLPTRAWGVLEEVGILTVKELQQVSTANLSKISGLGKDSIVLIRELAPYDPHRNGPLTSAKGFCKIP